MLKSILSTLTPIHPEGHRFIAIFVGITLFFFWFATPLGWVGIVLTLWCAYFFRDPTRVTPVRDGLVISPADGRISSIVKVVPPAELGLGEELRTRISVFMNVFDCHVNRAPMPGRVERIVYSPGIFLNAELDKASEDNERNALVLDLENDQKLAVVQIAGLVARRIVCWTKEDDILEAGERFGLIRFGSRLDVYLPPEHVAQVILGQRAVAGETILADLASKEDARDGRSA